MAFNFLRRNKTPPAPGPTPALSGRGGPARPVPAVPALDLGDGWTLVANLSLAGSPGIRTAAVGTRGTVVLGTLADPWVVHMFDGKPYCGVDPLEPAIAALLKASRAVAEALRGPLYGKPVVHPVLVAIGTASPLTHVDVLVTSPGSLAAALSSFPAVHGPAEVDASLAVLRGLAGDAVPRSFAPPAPHERSAAELREISFRPAPVATPQPWRDWSTTGAPPSPPAARGPSPCRHARPARARRSRDLSTLLVVGIVGAGVWYAATHSAAASYSPSPFVNMPTPSAPPTATPVASAAPVVPVTKAWQRPGDVIASSGGVALDSGVLVSLSGTAADSGQALLCSSVSVDNGSAYEVSYTDQDWTLELPNGDVQAPDAAATADAINQDQLLPGARVSGEVCFADPGQAGLYVFGFQPHPASVVTPGRIVWLVTLP